MKVSQAVMYRAPRPTPRNAAQVTWRSGRLTTASAGRRGVAAQLARAQGGQSDTASASKVIELRTVIRPGQPVGQAEVAEQRSCRRLSLRRTPPYARQLQHRLHARRASTSRPLCVKGVRLIFFVVRGAAFLAGVCGRDRRVGAGPGVAWPKSRRSGCEPAALATESFPGCPPGPLAVAARAARAAPAFRCLKISSLT